MYLRETRRTNKDGSVVSYLALAHNQRDPATGVPQARIIHHFGRSDQVDQLPWPGWCAASAASSSRPARAATETGEVSVVDSRPMGTAWVADQLWQGLGIGQAVRAAAQGRRLDAEGAERALFAMVANRLSPTPLSKLAGCAWVARRVFIEGLAEVSDDACYRTLAATEGQVAQRTELTARQRSILRALGVPEPPRFFEFTPRGD